MKSGFLLCAGAAVLLPGCQTEIAPASLRPPASVRVLHLDKAFRYEDPALKGLLSPSNPERGLLAGDYVAEFEDATGTYYRGVGTCVLVMTLPKPRTQVFADGGVYIPNDPRQPFQLYRYQQMETERVLALSPDAQGDWSAPQEEAGRALMLIGSMAAPQRQPGPPETLCGLKASLVDPKSPPAYTVVATVPRSPVASGMSSGLSTLLLNAIIANGRGKLRMIPPPAGVALEGATISGAGTPAETAPALVDAAPVVAAGRPANTRHLDAALLDGRTWSFPHPTNPARFGQVVLRFKDGRVDASNARSTSTGRYTVRDDMVCIAFEVNDWGQPCYYAYDGDASSPRVLVVRSGNSVPLAIR
jgi:hypothetical protein